MNRNLESVLKEQIIKNLEYSFEIDIFLNNEEITNIQDLYNIPLEKLQDLEIRYEKFINSY